MDIVDIPEHHIAYAILPYKRNQDVIKITSGKRVPIFAVSIVDGWHNLDYLPGNKAGRDVAEFVAEKFPLEFFNEAKGTIQKKAEKVAASMESQVFQMYPKHASCVGIFLFHHHTHDIIVALGSVVVLWWNGKEWAKPKHVGDYSLDPKKFPSDVSRFVGRGELKTDPRYSYKPDSFPLRSQ